MCRIWQWRAAGLVTCRWVSSCVGRGGYGLRSGGTAPLPAAAGTYGAAAARAKGDDGASAGSTSCSCVAMADSAAPYPPAAGGGGRGTGDTPGPPGVDRIELASEVADTVRDTLIPPTPPDASCSRGCHASAYKSEATQRREHVHECHTSSVGLHARQRDVHMRADGWTPHGRGQSTS